MSKTEDLSGTVLLTVLVTSEDSDTLEEITQVLEARYGVGVTERTAALFTAGHCDLADMLAMIDAWGAPLVAALGERVA